MTTPRRRLIRPTISPTSSPQTSPQLQKLRAKLERDRLCFAKWLARLKRAFTAIDKHQRRIARLERQITKLEGG